MPTRRHSPSASTIARCATASSMSSVSVPGRPAEARISASASSASSGSPSRCSASSTTSSRVSGASSVRCSRPSSTSSRRASVMPPGPVAFAMTATPSRARSTTRPPAALSSRWASSMISTCSRRPRTAARSAARSPGGGPAARSSSATKGSGLPGSPGGTSVRRATVIRDRRRAVCASASSRVPPSPRDPVSADPVPPRARRRISASTEARPISGGGFTDIERSEEGMRTRRAGEWPKRDSS